MTQLQGRVAKEMTRLAARRESYVVEPTSQSTASGVLIGPAGSAYERQLAAEQSQAEASRF